MHRLLAGFALLCATLLNVATPLPGGTPPSPKGTLVIVGGGGFPADVEAAFLRASGGPGGTVGIIPTSTSDPDGALKEWQADLEKAGLHFVALDVRKREDAENPQLLAAAATCTGFWFSGGDQNRVGDKIVGTPLQALVLNRYRAGACIGGTSAGAAIMSKLMLTGDDRNGKEALSEFGPGAYQTREGMGFLPARVVVDQHFLRRGRENRLFSVLMEHPTFLGLGIDEATALVVKDGKATVLGQRSVMVFDGSGLSQQGGGFQNLRIHLLKAGQSLDLESRKVTLP